MAHKLIPLPPTGEGRGDTAAYGQRYNPSTTSSSTLHNASGFRLVPSLVFTLFLPARPSLTAPFAAPPRPPSPGPGATAPTIPIDGQTARTAGSTNCVLAQSRSSAWELARLLTPIGTECRTERQHRRHGLASPRPRRGSYTPTAVPTMPLRFAPKGYRPTRHCQVSDSVYRRLVPAHPLPHYQAPQGTTRRPSAQTVLPYVAPTSPHTHRRNKWCNGTNGGDGGGRVQPFVRL